MGTYAELFRGGRIPDEKKEEFMRRVELLFQAGGMMEVEHVQLYGKKLVTLKKASMHHYGMDFCYNYFDDENWENAGFSRKNCQIWSEKIGWSHFCRAVVSAYVLEELYLDGPAIAMINGEFVTSHGFTGWINYLFQEHFAIKNGDPWKLFEAMHEHDDIELGQYAWEGFVYDLNGLIGHSEIKAVLEGTDPVIEEYKAVITETRKERSDKGITFADAITCIKSLLAEYQQESDLKQEEQLSLLLKMCRTYYEQDKPDIDKEYEDEKQKEILRLMVLLDAPAYVIKVFAEIYNKDFWELWGQVRDVAKRKGVYGAAPDEIPPISTISFFRQNPDDMILFWEGDGEIEFSEDLKKWFSDLGSRYDEIMSTGFSIERPLNWILDLMEYADENYYRVYTMNDFFEETIENLKDIRYLSLWKIYDEMLHDPVMEEAGNVIFVPDDPEYENIGLHYLGEQPRRRLRSDWTIMRVEEKNNKARITFRHYMALVANRRLRKEVFGF